MNVTFDAPVCVFIGNLSGHVPFFKLLAMMRIKAKDDQIFSK